MTNFDSHRALTALLARLALPRRSAEVKRVVSDFQAEHIGHEEAVHTALEIMHSDGQPKEIPLEWPHLKKPHRRIFSSVTDWSPFEIAFALERKGYFSFLTALYLNNLTKQIPSTFYISVNRPTRTQSNSSGMDEFRLVSEFLKPRRETKKIGLLESQKYFVVERNVDQPLGVSKKTIKTKQGRSISITTTNIERTLIDSIIYPNRSGGLVSIRSAFGAARRRMRIPVLIAVYKEYELTYPYWQCIGLMIENEVGARQAEDWNKAFPHQKIEFYIDRPFKPNWRKDNRWQVYHPPNLFRSQ